MQCVWVVWGARDSEGAGAAEGADGVERRLRCPDKIVQGAIVGTGAVE